MSRLVAGQSGRIARRQLLAVGITGTEIRSWQRRGYLIRRLPGVYAVGHAAPSVEAVLTEAVLYAGPEAMLSHATAAWWLGLLHHRSPVVHVSTPRRCKSQPGVDVHDRRRLTRIWHRNLPVAPVGEILLDLAATSPQAHVRHALANAEYHGLLEIDTLDALCGQGRPGSIALRRALRHHQPELAHTQSAFERLMLALCERERLPVPEFNRQVAGLKVDALWREQRVVVEVDGRDGHASWARIRNDHRRDLTLRAAGYVVLRYVWEQLTGQPAAVTADIRAALQLP